MKNCVVFAAALALAAVSSGCGGNRAKPHVKTLNDPQAFAYARLAALKELQDIAPLDEDAEAAVADTLADSNPFLRKEAATTLRLAGSESSLPAMERAIAVEVDEEVRAEIAMAMEAMRPGSSSEAMTTAVAQADASVFESPSPSTTGSFSPIADVVVAPPALETVMEPQGPPPPSLQAEEPDNARDMAAFDPPFDPGAEWASQPDIEPTIETESEPVPTPVSQPRTPMVMTTNATGEGGILGEVAVRLSDPDPDVRREAAIALRLMGGPESLPALQNALETESDPSVQSEISKSLAALGPTAEDTATEAAQTASSAPPPAQEEQPVATPSPATPTPETAAAPIATPSAEAPEAFPPFAWPTPGLTRQTTPEATGDTVLPPAEEVEEVKAMAWAPPDPSAPDATPSATPSPTPSPTPTPTPTPDAMPAEGKGSIRLLSSIMDPDEIAPGGSARMELTYEVRELDPGEQVRVTEERSILFDGRVVREFRTEFQRENGRYVTEANLTVPEGAPRGAYALRGRVHLGETTMEMEATFKVTP